MNPRPDVAVVDADGEFPYEEVGELLDGGVLQLRRPERLVDPGRADDPDPVRCRRIAKQVDVAADPDPGAVDKQIDAGSPSLGQALAARGPHVAPVDAAVLGMIGSEEIDEQVLVR
jgi:hypothetical protein